MTVRLLVATTNPGKARELRALLAERAVDVVTPADVCLDLDVVESGATFEANAILKARAFAAASGLPTLADDSGLEVDALGGEPGVRSARWVPGSDGDRVAALLARLEGVPADRRTARFRSVAALVVPIPRDVEAAVAAAVAAAADGVMAHDVVATRVVATSAGAVEGRIAFAPRGAGGFGYDPVFLVEDGGLDGTRTMAELDAATKNRLSHRGRAVAGLGSAIARLAERPLDDVRADVHEPDREG